MTLLCDAICVGEGRWELCTGYLLRATTHSTPTRAIAQKVKIMTLFCIRLVSSASVSAVCFACASHDGTRVLTHGHMRTFDADHGVFLRHDEFGGLFSQAAQWNAQVS